MQLADFILAPVPVTEVQVNQNYAVLLEHEAEDAEVIRNMTFHPLREVPTDEQMTAEWNRLGDLGSVIMFVTVMYRQASTLQLRSLRNDNMFSIDTTDYRIVQNLGN